MRSPNINLIQLHEKFDIFLSFSWREALQYKEPTLQILKERDILKQIRYENYNTKNAEICEHWVLLSKILELLSPSPRVNAFAEHIVMHLEPIQSDLISYPLHILLHRRQGNIATASRGGATTDTINSGDGGVRS